MAKVSQYAIDTTPSGIDYLLGVEASGPTTKRYLLSDLLTYFLNNIPAAEGTFGFVSTGLVWSGDAYASTRAASMTSGRIRVNSTFLAITGVTSRVFTASRDTYVDVLDNLDGTGTIVYTEVTNNNASPALASNSTRIGIIVTGAANIANVGSINQGEEGKVLPIASSIPYMSTDSLGNIICNRSPNQITLVRRTSSTFTSSSSTTVQVTGLSLPIIIPSTLRKILVEGMAGAMSAGAVTTPTINLWEGTVVSGTLLEQTRGATIAAAGYFGSAHCKAIYTPSSGLKTYNMGTFNTAATSTDLNAATGIYNKIAVTLN